MNVHAHDVGVFVLASVKVTDCPAQMVVGAPVKLATGVAAAQSGSWKEKILVLAALEPVAPPMYSEVAQKVTPSEGSSTTWP